MAPPSSQWDVPTAWPHCSALVSPSLSFGGDLCRFEGARTGVRTAPASQTSSARGNPDQRLIPSRRGQPQSPGDTWGYPGKQDSPGGTPSTLQHRMEPRERAGRRVGRLLLSPSCLSFPSRASVSPGIPALWLQAGSPRAVSPVPAQPHGSPWSTVTALLPNLLFQELQHSSQALARGRGRLLSPWRASLSTAPPCSRHLPAQEHVCASRARSKPC